MRGYERIYVQSCTCTKVLRVYVMTALHILLKLLYEAIEALETFQARLNLLQNFVLQLCLILLYYWPPNK